MDWAKAIEFIQREQEQTEDAGLVLIWKRLQLGHRTQDLLMTIQALGALKDDAATGSPEWQSATKWLAWQRSQQSNLMLDMLWSQLESGNRTPELLALIRQSAQAPPSPPVEPSPVFEAPPTVEPPPSVSF